MKREELKEGMILHSKDHPKHDIKITKISKGLTPRYLTYNFTVVEQTFSTDELIRDFIIYVNSHNYEKIKELRQ